MKMKSRPFLLKRPNLDKARAKLKEKSGDWKTTWGWILPKRMLPSASKRSRETSGKSECSPMWDHPTPPKSPPPELARSNLSSWTISGPRNEYCVLPRLMLPFGSKRRNGIRLELPYSPNWDRPKPPKFLKAKLARSNLSNLSIDGSRNEKCMLLRKLPLELRLAIFSHVLGNDAFRLVTIPWRVIAVPDIEGNLSMTGKYFDANKAWGDTELDSNNNAPEVFIRSSRTAILTTCRQIYPEAVDLLYTTNTFILHDFSTLATFAKSIPPQRLNAIRSLTVHYSPNTSIPYEHAHTSDYDLPFNLDWFWEIIVGMQNLRNLDVYMEAYAMTRLTKEGHVEGELTRLRPLKRLRGLSNFRLQIGYLQLDESIDFESPIPAFREELMEVVKRPRGSQLQLSTLN